MRRSSGFSLIEVLVALALAGTVLLVAGGFFWLQYRIAERLDANRRADAALENAYEELLAGALPLESGSLPGTGDGIELLAVVLEDESSALTDLTLIATFELGGESRSRRLEARLYTP